MWSFITAALETNTIFKNDFSWFNFKNINSYILIFLVSFRKNIRNDLNL